MGPAGLFEVVAKTVLRGRAKKTKRAILLVLVLLFVFENPCQIEDEDENDDEDDRRGGSGHQYSNDFYA